MAATDSAERAAANSDAKVNLLLAMNAVANLHLRDVRRELEAERTQLQAERAERSHLRSIAARFETVSGELADAHRRYQLLADEMHGVRLELANAQQRQRLLAEDFQNKHDQLRAASEDLQKVRHELANKHDQLRAVSEELKAARERVELMLRSSSWRITAPLRKLMSLLQRARR